MTLIVVFLAIVVLLFGYYVMDKVDRFVNNEIYQSNEYFTDKYTHSRECEEEVMLIYGDNELTELLKTYCNSQNYIYETITEIKHISTQYKYTCLFALSYNDVDNLMISSVGFKIYSIQNVITLCNSRDNLKIYKEFNFDKVLVYNEGIDKLFNIIKGLMDDAVKNKNKV